MEPGHHAYRWDLDKTYLRTEFDTLRDLVRTALEPAWRKRTVPGAAALLREISATGPAGIYILSGSPEQMRRVLEEKLRLDGVRWDRFTLKPNLRNMLRLRFRALRDQVGYKLPSLLAGRAETEEHVTESLFGDDAEADAFVYSLYADLLAGRVGDETLLEVLRRARTYDDVVADILRLARRLRRSADAEPRDVVRHVFIHLDRRTEPDTFALYGRRLCPFFNYFQPALVLLEHDLLGAPATLRVGAEMVVHHAFSPDALWASFEDLAGRRHVSRRSAVALLDALGTDLDAYGPAASVLAKFGAALEPSVRSLDSMPDDSPPDVIDYVTALEQDLERRAELKRRIRALTR
ncbi:MAG: hypothetical protein IT379_31115 [Deltaproteobacteria bacterium]|nr:hypothetical protein [Deltaproteobacteria bacterium]